MVIIFAQTFNFCPMKKNYIFSLLIALSLTQMNAQTAVTGWDFNASTTNPSSGTGTLSFVGGTGSATYINNSGTQALAFADFPDNTVGSGTAGIKFAFSTVGYVGISTSFDTAGHNQSSRWQQYEYTTDGTTWNILSNNAGGLNATFTTRTLNFPASCDNNPNFAFRIVSIFNPSGGTQYEQVQGGGYNGSNGKWYFDNVAISYSSLSVKENNIVNLKMYPNPAKSVINITSDNFKEKSIEVYSTMGKMVLASKVTTSPVDVTSLSTGMYIVKVTEEGKIDTLRLMIN